MSAAELTLETGVASFAENAGPDVLDDVKNASAVRWGFNPAAKIYVGDRITGYERDPETGQARPRQHIKAGVLTPFRNTTYNVPRKNDNVPPPSYGNLTPRTQALIARTKYAVEIANEIQDAYSDTGFVIVEALTGIDDESEVTQILRACLGERTKAAKHPAIASEIIPVIPAMLERVMSAREHEAVRSSLIGALRQARGWAQMVTGESRRLLQTKTPGGGSAKIEFDPRDIRCYLALGEQVPNESGTMPPQPAPTVDVETRELVHRLAEHTLSRDDETERSRLREEVKAELKAELLAELRATPELTLKPKPKPKTEPAEV